MKGIFWICGLAAASLCGCATKPTGGTTGNRAIIRRYFEEWANHGDAATADALIATNLTLHNPPAVLRSLEEYKASMAKFHGGFPDLRFTIEDEIVAGDKVAVRWLLRGTQTGEFQGHPASGKAVDITGTSTFRLSEGRIQEIWVNMDRLGLMQQLGWLPAPAPPGK
jgi:steroid delta-isomerase-like uncharacterized protein